MDYEAERWVAPLPPNCPSCNLPVDRTSAYCARCGHDLIGGLTRGERRRKRIHCIYCEVEGRRSVEDIFPSWLARHFQPRGKRASNVVRRSTEYKAFEQTPLSVAPARGEANRAIYRLTTETVCDSCNNRWMSRLQAEAKPILLRLLETQTLALSASDRFALSRWAAMTFTNIGFAEQQPSTEQHQRTALLRGEMPTGWRIGVGLLTGLDHAGAYERYSMAMPIGMGDKPFTTFTSGWFAIENLAFGNIHALGDRVLELTQYSIGATPDDYLKSAGLSPLWPSPDEPWVGESALVPATAILRLRVHQ